MNRTHRKAAAALFTAALALSTLGLSVGTSSAETTARECTDGRVCIWNNNGEKYTSVAGYPEYIPLTGTQWDDNVYYVQNNTPYAYCAWQHNEQDVHKRGKYTQLDANAGTDLSQNRLRNQISLLTKGVCPSELPGDGASVV
ncbi:peptidase inhibitor family I36 protein [Streptomyces thermolilacinus]|uniref:peptidase inhibitor family I36 protein n=1 Tax=Streptomyces thermolilacinus TaxID=285540 RepID=UPI003410C1A6